jgi:hypothetical protein
MMRQFSALLIRLRWPSFDVDRQYGLKGLSLNGVGIQESRLLWWRPAIFE